MCVCVCVYTIGLVGRVFANGQGDRSSIPGRVILKTQKMVPDTFLRNTQHYKVSIKCKVEQSKERSRAFPRISLLLLLKNEPLGRTRLQSQTLLLNYIYIYIYVCVCVCVCVRERERERESVCVCVCV